MASSQRNPLSNTHCFGRAWGRGHEQPKPCAVVFLGRSSCALCFYPKQHIISSSTPSNHVLSPTRFLPTATPGRAAASSATHPCLGQKTSFLSTKELSSAGLERSPGCLPAPTPRAGTACRGSLGNPINRARQGLLNARRSSGAALFDQCSRQD